MPHAPQISHIAPSERGESGVEGEPHPDDLGQGSEAPTTTRLIPRRKRLSEEADDYPRVVVCDSRKRIIECRDGLQWIVQTLLRGRWVGSSYCRSRVGLIEVASRHGFSPASLAELGLLPDWIEEKPGEGAR